MKYRKFGRQNWQVSEIGYGMWGMASWSGSDDQESLHSLQAAADLGCNFFDTALAYGEGHSEGLLGRLLRANPNRELYSATKVPPKNRQWPSRRGVKLDDTFPPDYIENCIEKSLKNAGVDHFHLLQFHVWEDDWLQDDRWLRKMEDLKTAGKISAIGISINRWEPWNGVNAVRSGYIDAVQVIYNIFDQNPEDELFPACQEHDVAVIARVPFDEGTLTGNLTKDSCWPEGDWRNTYFVPENLHASVDRAEALKPLMPETMTLPELALRFILQHDAVSTIIPGMRKLDHVKQNIATSDGTRLDAELLKELRKHRWVRKPSTWSQ